MGRKRFIARANNSPGGKGNADALEDEIYATPVFTGLRCDTFDFMQFRGMGAGPGTGRA
jgi:hypothetical protein